MNSALTEREPTKEEFARHEAIQRLEYAHSQLFKAIAFAKGNSGLCVRDALDRAADAMDDARRSSGGF